MNRSRCRRAALLLSVTGWGLLACASGGPGPAPRPNVLLVVIDALRADHLGCYGYRRDTSPALDRIAAAGVLFEAAIATSSVTRTSMASLLTSLHPLEHGIRYVDRQGGGLRDLRDRDGRGEAPRIAGMDEGFVTLAEAFSERGFETMAVVTNPYLRKDHGFGQGFATYLEGQWTADQVVDRFLNWRRERDGSPFFAFLHFIDVHAPYLPPPPYDSMFGNRHPEGRPENPPPGLSPEAQNKVSRVQFGNPEVPPSSIVRRLLRRGEIEIDAEMLAAMVGKYDGEIRRVDDSLARLFREMDRPGSGRDTLVAVTSDHGDEFLDHDDLGHGQFLYDSVIRVPLILRLPGTLEGGRRVSEPVSLVDLMPTLLELSGGAAPEGISGRSLATLAVPERSPEPVPLPVFSEIVLRKLRRESIRTGRYKLIRTRFFPRSGGGPEEGEDVGAGGIRDDWQATRVERELFDLAEDPGETVNLSGDRPELLAELETRLDAHLDGLQPRVASKRILLEMDPGMERRLRALGYLE